MQSWLKRRQLEQRPSSVASKPEQRIWRRRSAHRTGQWRGARRGGHWLYLAAAAVAAGNGSALAGRGRLVVLLDVLRRRGLLAVWILRRRRACPLVGAWQAVLLLLLLLRVVLGVLVGGHVGARLLRRGRGREGGVDLGGGQVSQCVCHGQSGDKEARHAAWRQDAGANLRARAEADRRRLQAAAGSRAAASGWASGPGRAGAGTWRRRWRRRCWRRGCWWRGWASARGEGWATGCRAWGKSAVLQRGCCHAVTRRHEAAEHEDGGSTCARGRRRSEGVVRGTRGACGVVVRR